MSSASSPGPNDPSVFWLDTPEHRAYLEADARRQFAFFRGSLESGPGFRVLDRAGHPLPSRVQELHTTTRLVHSYALGHLLGIEDAERIVDHGMVFLLHYHRDSEHGGYVWAVEEDKISDSRKLAYGHVFTLLAGASAKEAGHPEADTLIDDASAILDAHFWDEDAGLFRDEFNRDWTPFSTYRGMNANMHGVEALLSAYEATGQDVYLTRAGRILDFFVGRMAPAHGWRLPEHYHADWSVDRNYSGNPMFRPAGTTPGHSFELGRLTLQYLELAARPHDRLRDHARRLIQQALTDAWQGTPGGLAYTLDFDGSISIADRYWWPVTEAIGALAALIKLDRRSEDEAWYRKLWQFADEHLIDHKRGGWFPELDQDGALTETQFQGKPDIYHSLQACLFPLTPGVSRYADALRRLSA